MLKNSVCFIVCAFLIALISTSVSAEQQKVLILGDSISAGYGMDPELGWVNLLSVQLRDENSVTLINASASGETSSGGLARLPALLSRHQPDVVVIELGGNDGLRGYSLKLMKQNLGALIRLSQDAGAEVLLFGMEIPPSYGARYARQFKQVYPALAKAQAQGQKITLLPFYMQSIALNPELMQADGIHPAETAQGLIVDNVRPTLMTLLSTLSPVGV